MTERTVFVVDDDPSLGRGLAKLVRALGYEPQTFASAESFLAVSDTARGCLLVDVRMPGMSGLDLLDELARRRVSLPAIIMNPRRCVPPLRSWDSWRSPSRRVR